MTESPPPPTNTPLLETISVSRYFADGDVSAVKEVSLRIYAGQYISLVGKSGSGKSTLLNLLGALDEPSSGTIFFRGEPLANFGDLARFRSQELGFIFQSFHLVSVLTAEQNVQLPMFESGRTAPQRLARAHELLELVGLSHRAKHLTSKLSGGERQRVAIARALANDPSLLLADEPTGNLDTKTTEEIIRLFAHLHQAGKTILMVTHDPTLAAQAEITWTMVDGRLQFPV